MESQKDTVIAKWTDQLTQLFVSAMVDEVKKGNRTTTTFNKIGWNNIKREFNKQTGREYTLTQFRNRSFKLKESYGSFKKFLGQSGFGWDNVNKRVVVEDDTVWEFHIKANPKWAKFRNEGFPLYPQLCIVFGDTYATGEYTTGNVQELESSDDNDNAVFCENDDGVALGTREELGAQDPQMEEGSGNEYEAEDGLDNEPRTTPVREKHRLNRTPNTKRRRKSTAYDFAGTCKVIQEAIKLKMSQSSQTSVTSQAPQSADPYSMGAVIAILKGMPEMDPSIYTKAVNHACLNPAWREAFVLTEPGWRLALLNSI